MHSAGKGAKGERIRAKRSSCSLPQHSIAADPGSLGQLPGWDTGWQPPPNRVKIKFQQGRRSERPDPQPKARPSSPSPKVLHEGSDMFTFN